MSHEAMTGAVASLRMQSGPKAVVGAHAVR